MIADDHAVVRSGLRMLLDSESGFEVVAEAGDVDCRAALRARPSPGRAGAGPEHARRLEPGGDSRPARGVPRDPDRRAHDAGRPGLRARGDAGGGARLRAEGGRRRRAGRGGAQRRRRAHVSAPAARRAARGRAGARRTAQRPERPRDRGAAADRARSHEQRDRASSSSSACGRSSRTARTSSRSSGSRRGPSWSSTRSSTSCWKPDAWTSSCCCWRAAPRRSRPGSARCRSSCSGERSQALRPPCGASRPGRWRWRPWWVCCCRQPTTAAVAEVAGGTAAGVAFMLGDAPLPRHARGARRRDGRGQCDPHQRAGVLGAARAQRAGGPGDRHRLCVGHRRARPVRDPRDRAPEHPGGDEHGDPDGGRGLRARAAVLGGGADQRAAAGRWP